MKIPLTLGKLRELIEPLTDETVIDIEFDNILGYIYDATVVSSFDDKLILDLKGTQD